MYLIFAQLLVSIVLLFIGTQLLVNSSISLSKKLKINSIIIGFTIMSLATSLPEFFVTLQSALNGYYDFAIGNVIGSNISNISFVLGVIAIVSPIFFNKNEIISNYVPLIIISCLFVIVSVFFNELNIIFGLVSIILLLSLNVLIYIKSSKPTDQNMEDNEFMLLGKNLKIDNISLLFFILFFGSIVLWLGSDMLIVSSKKIAHLANIDDRIISISIVALGTSLPELFSSIYAAYKKETSLALGNLLGSNIYNILAVLGITSLFHSISINNILHIDLKLMLLITFMIFPILYLRRILVNNLCDQTMYIHRIEGVILISIYIYYIIFIVF